MVSIHLNIGCDLAKFQEHNKKYCVGEFTISPRKKNVTLTFVKPLFEESGAIGGDADIKMLGHLVGPNNSGILFITMYVKQANASRQSRISETDFWYNEAKAICERADPPQPSTHIHDFSVNGYCKCGFIQLLRNTNTKRLFIT